MKKPKIECKYYIIWALPFILALALYLVPRFIRPRSYVGSDILGTMKWALIATLICDVLIPVFFVIATIYSIRFGIDMYVRGRDRDRLLKTLEQMANRLSGDYDAVIDQAGDDDSLSSKRIFAIASSVGSGIVMFLLSTLFAIGIYEIVNTLMSTDEKDNNPIRIVRSLRDVIKDEREDSIITVELKEINLQRRLGGKTDSISSDHASYRWLVLDDGRKLPIGYKDYHDISNRRHKYTAGRFVLKVHYYEHSGLIKTYSFEDRDWQAEDYASHPVEITMDEDYTLHRPSDMSDYGEIAWVIKRDGELLKVADIEEYKFFSITATYYDQLELGDNRLLSKHEPGHYTAQLVKVMRYENYLDCTVIPISNEISFVINETTKITGAEIIKQLDGKKLEMTWNKDDMTVRLPPLAEDYDEMTGVYLVAELTGTGFNDEYFEQYGHEEYRYSSEEPVKLKKYTCHYKLYVGAKDENGELVPISNVIEFDYITEEQLKKQHEREYFYDLLTALENNDTAALKAMLSKKTQSKHEEFFLNLYLDDMCRIYKGKTLDRDKLAPKTDEYISSDGNEHLYRSYVHVDTDCGHYYIALKTCLRSNDSSNIGVYEMSVTDRDTNEHAYVNDGSLR